MSALAVADTTEDEQPPANVRVDVIGDSRALFTRSMVVSVLAHLGILASALSFSLATQHTPEVVATPVDHALDVSMIPISALETLLPRGVPQAQPPASPPPSVVMSEPPKAPASLEAPTKPAPITKPRQEHRRELKKDLEPKKESEKPQLSASSHSPAQPPQAHAIRPDSEGSSAGANMPASQQAYGQRATEQPLGTSDGEASSLEQARISYQDIVATRLARVKRYPERAVRRRMTGEGSIRLEISSDGSVAAVQIIRSTNASILDDELRAMVDRAAPFPAFPTDLRKNRLALIVPITFRLEG